MLNYLLKLLFFAKQLNVSYKVLPSTYTLKQQAKFFAQLTVASHDASITGWKLKYSALFWRPITAIRNGNGNVSAAIPTWTPLLGTPPHPEYASGHMFTAGAALQVRGERL